jgi:hypothetical protein
MGHSEIDCPNPALLGSDGKLPYDVRLRALRGSPGMNNTVMVLIPKVKNP